MSDDAHPCEMAKLVEILGRAIDRPAGREDTPPEPIEMSAVDWGSLVSLARKHRAVPLFYAGCNDALSDKQKEELQRHVAADALRMTTLTRELGRLARLLAQAGIRAIPIKGPVLAAQAYGSISMRQCDDLDLIVSREDLLAAIGLLTEEGYQLREPPPCVDRAAYLTTLREWALERDGRMLQLDIKPVLISHTVSRPELTKHMIDECRSMRLENEELPYAPGPEMMFLIVCTQGVHDMWQRVSAIADAAMLLTSHPDADWQRVLNLAGVWGKKRTLLTGVHCAEALFRVAPPEQFRVALAGDSRSAALAAAAMAELKSPASSRVSPVRQHVFEMKARERFRDRCRFLLRVAFVPGPVEFGMVTLPRWLRFLYYLMRPWRILLTRLGVRVSGR